MAVRILYFAWVREKTGKPEEIVDLPPGVGTVQELVAWLKGRGVAAVNYPTGMNLGGDPSQALIHATTTGSFVVTLSSVDLGQGIKTIAAQCAAETLGLPFENIIVDTADTDTGRTAWGRSPRAAPTASATR